MLHHMKKGGGGGGGGGGGMGVDKHLEKKLTSEMNVFKHEDKLMLICQGSQFILK